jgi:hypothetical protein
VTQQSPERAQRAARRRGRLVVAAGVAITLGGLALLVWAWLSLQQYGDAGGRGLGELFIAIGGFAAVAAGTDLRHEAVRRLRALRER